MPDVDTPNTKSGSSDNERLREIATQIMVYLEDAHEAAMRAQAPGLDSEEIEQGISEVRARVRRVLELLKMV